MRPRRAVRSNLTQVVDHDDDDDDISPPPAAGDRDVDGSDFEEAEDVLMEEEDADEDDEVMDEPVIEATPKATRTPRKAKTASKPPAKSKGKQLKKSTPTQGPHTIPPYPSDARATRVYAGHLKRWDRFRVLTEILYGPSPESIAIMNEMRERWADHPILPARSYSTDGGVLPSPWVPEGFEAEQAAKFRTWFERYRASGYGAQISRAMSAQEASHYLPHLEGGLVAFSGPLAAQQEVALGHGGTVPLDGSGSVFDDADRHPDVWMFNVGGTARSIAWAPTGEAEQLLALAVVEENYHDDPESSAEASTPKHGSIQLWRIPSDKDDEDIVRLSHRPPEFIGALCFEWGLPRRLFWCPVVLHSRSIYGLLAVLFEDGLVRVLEVPRSESSYYECINSPIATLGIEDEYNVKVTCLSWCGLNRLVLGHTDGSITLWSVQPTLMLQRYAVHHNYVLDICTGYPSAPYLVSSNPVGGHCKVVDLARPVSEQTYVPIAVTTFQPGLHAWSEHLQGFVAAYPSSNPGATGMGFLHCRFYPPPRSIYTGYCQPTCCAVGAAHPFLLVGHQDGSLWSVNTMRKVLFDRAEPVFKTKLFEHEHSAAAQQQQAGTGSVVRGAVRILQGFEPEINEHPRADRLRRVQQRKREKLAGAAAKKGGRKKEAAATAQDEDEDDDSNVDDDLAAEEEGEAFQAESGAARGVGTKGTNSEPSRAVIHDPMTRVSAIAWNPNTKFGWWAAAAMGSGIIRIMDLGVEG